MEYYLDAWRNYVNFKGRATRKQFWMFVLINILISIGLQIIEAILGFVDMELLSGLYGLAVLLPGLAITARRLHDVNKSAWWLLLLLIPFIGGLVILIFNVMKGTDGTNKYGEPVHESTAERTTATGESIREADVVETTSSETETETDTETQEEQK
jgi:uncharacterized membrane protein YhaH (DUF805 family)